MALFRWPAWDPLAPLRVMQREMERLSGSRMSAAAHRVGGGGYPPVNVYDCTDEIVVLCEVPGLQKDDLELTITGETLVVKGQKKPPQNHDSLRYEIRERGFGEFSRTIVLPDRVDADGIEASLKSGILEIHLPKSEAARPRQIPVS